MSARFETYCRRKEELARAAHIPGYRTVAVRARPAGALAIENRWTRTLRARRWIEVLDAGDPPVLAHALRQLRERGVERLSAIGGRQVAGALLAEGLVQDLYLTTAAVDGGAPGTPFYTGAPPAMSVVLEKAGQGPEAGVRFEHFRL